MSRMTSTRCSIWSMDELLYPRECEYCDGEINYGTVVWIERDELVLHYLCSYDCRRFWRWGKMIAKDPWIAHLEYVED